MESYSAKYLLLKKQFDQETDKALHSPKAKPPIKYKTMLQLEANKHPSLYNEYIHKHKDPEE